MLTIAIQKLKTNGVNVDNNSINVSNNSQIEIEREIERETETEIETDIETEINLLKIKSIYLSSNKYKENKNLDDMMDETEKSNFEQIIANCELNILDPELAMEIKDIVKEMYINPTTKQNILKLNSKKLLYALKNFAIANTKKQIQIPKAYFKKCILTALEQTELSAQYDINEIYNNLKE